MEPSYAIKRRNGYQTEGRRPALRAGLRPQLELWLGLAWPAAQYRAERRAGSVHFPSSTPNLTLPTLLTSVSSARAEHRPRAGTYV